MCWRERRSSPGHDWLPLSLQQTTRATAQSRKGATRTCSDATGLRQRGSLEKPGESECTLLSPPLMRKCATEDRSVCLSVCLHVSLAVCPPVCLFNPTVGLSVALSVCLENLADEACPFFGQYFSTEDEVFICRGCSSSVWVMVVWFAGGWGGVMVGGPGGLYVSMWCYRVRTVCKGL